MPVRMGQAFWPGVKGFISCTYTCSHDAGAGIATLEIPEQDVREIQSFGTLVVTDGANTVRLNRCRVADIGFGSSPTGGRTIVLSIADRRWMWRYGSVSGNWNQIDPYPDPDLFPPGEYVAAGGPFAPGTYRPAHLLMADCLALMNEVNSPLIDPAPVVPVPVQWDDEVPASALSSLAATLGYRLVYQPVSDRVLLCPAGLGKVLPDNLPIITNSASLALPQRPNTIALVGGSSIFHDLIPLEPIGMEKNGTFRPIDQLSYRPAGGWGTCNATSMWQARATDQLTVEEARDLARRYVWRAFWPKLVDLRTGVGPHLNVGGYGRVTDRKQLVLLPRIYDATRGITGEPNTEPAYARGKVYIGNSTGVFTGGLGRAFDHTSVARRMPWLPTVDTARGIVSFERQMYELSGAPPNARKIAPELYLYTGFHIRSVVGRVPERFNYGGTLAGLVELGCPPEVLKHPEMVLVNRTVRKDADFSVLAQSDNLDDLVPRATYFLNAANAKYEIGAAADRTYAGIYPIEPDGAIQQVTWSVGGGQPATTRASRNTEHATYLPSFPERRRNEDLRRFMGRARNAEAEGQGPNAPNGGGVGRTQLPPLPDGGGGDY